MTQRLTSSITERCAECGERAIYHPTLEGCRAVRYLPDPRRRITADDRQSRPMGARQSRPL